MIWNEKMECADRDTMRSVQLEKLKKTVKHAYDNVSHYRNKMDEAGVKPEDIKSLDDITKLPFITKEDIAANYPTGLFAEPMKDIVRIHASSGTTGKPKIVGYTRNDLDMWGECVARGMTMAGASQESVVHVSYGYGLFTGWEGAHLWSRNHLGRLLSREQRKYAEADHFFTGYEERYPLLHTVLCN